MSNRLLDDERVVIPEQDIERYKENGYNDDLLPLLDKKRNWTKFNFFTLWMGSVYNVPSYLAVGAFLFMGLSPINVGIALIISTFFIAAIMVLNGKAGSKYGIPSTIVMKASYGERGALFPGFLRGIIAAIMWYGLQNFTGSQALLILMSKLIPGFQNLAPNFSFFGISLPGLICFLVFSLINMGIGLGGGNTIKKFTAILNPLIYIVFGGMTIWAIFAVGGISPILNFKAQTTGDTFSPIIVYLFIISSTLSVWGAPAVSSSDFSKNAKSFKAQFVGQTLSFFVAYILFACSSVCILIGASIKYDTQMWNVLDIINSWDSLLAIIFSSIVLLMTTISTNATGNIVPAAYQLSAIFPKKVNYKTGVIIASIISFVIMPWKLMENQDSITLFLNIIGAVVGPVSGIMIAHYFTVAKQKLNVNDLYAKSGSYHLYPNGINPKAFIATFTGALIPIISIFVPSLKLLSGLAWIIGFVVAFLTYFILTRNHKPSTSSQ